jgi:hypothetical protein
LIILERGAAKRFEMPVAVHAPGALQADHPAVPGVVDIATVHKQVDRALDALAVSVLGALECQVNGVNGYVHIHFLSSLIASLSLAGSGELLLNFLSSIFHLKIFWICTRPEVPKVPNL